jgi:RHS repeat-associated protein
MRPTLKGAGKGTPFRDDSSTAVPPASLIPPANSDTGAFPVDFDEVASSTYVKASHEPVRIGRRRVLLSQRTHFRKACCFRFHSHRSQSQSVAKTAQTWFEGPFGETIRATGPMAKANPFRFSTKYQDDETDLLYYGYRYYNASTGRWLSRDAMEEYGDFNLYIFAGNAPTSTWDYLGLKCCLLTYPMAPRGRGPGHSALECDNGTYISAWPDGMHTKSADERHLRGITPQRTCSECFDESKVKEWYDKNAITFDWSLLCNNCADAVMQAMAAALQQTKPTCPKACAPRYYTVEDRLSDAGLMTPGRAESALEALNEAKCNRYYCKENQILPLFVR